jgi:DUF1365 family protein
MSSQIYIGQVMHQRFFPMAYRFQYGVFSLRVDVDSVETDLQSVKGLGFNRFNLVSLYSQDYGARSDKSWRDWFTELMADYGIDEHFERIELVCMPRYLGFSFNPLAMWYGYNKNRELIAVVAEVSNTFGQWHHYVLANAGQPLDDRLTATADKVFHVSPFMNMNCEYRFRFNRPDENYRLAIYETEDSKPLLNAIQVGKAVDLNSKNLIKVAAQLPLNSLKVIFMIHWWALKIWLKGGKFHRTPKHLEDIDYSHTAMKLC